jgi:hypothetical protein
MKKNRDQSGKRRVFKSNAEKKEKRGGFAGVFQFLDLG